MSTITYIPEYQVVLSRRCEYACGYCNFPNLATPLLPSPKQVRKYLRLAARLKATQITLTAGEGSESIVEVHNTCRYFGYHNWGDYLRAICGTVLNYHSDRVFFPVLDVGKLPFSMLRTVSNVTAGVRLLVDSADDTLLETLAHDKAPHKTFAERCAALEEIGRLRIPVFTGTRIGIGESEQSWSLLASRINLLHRRFHNVSNFCVVPFRPLPYTAMSFLPPVAPDKLQRALRVLRSELDPKIPMSLDTPETPIDPRAYMEDELTDMGLVRVGTNEKLNIDAPHVLGEVRLQSASRGDKVCERLPWMNKFIRDYELHPAINRNIDLYMERWNDRHRSDEESSGPFLCPPATGHLRPLD